MKNYPYGEDFLPVVGQMVHECIDASLKVIKDLGDSGREKVKADSLHIGGSSDSVTRADGESELAMLKVINDYGIKHHIKFLVLGEEIGWQVVGDKTSRRVFTVFMDGLDGTDVYAKLLEFDSGPMISVCFGDNPNFDDVLAAGVGLIETSWVIIADKYHDVVTWYQSNVEPIELPTFNERIREEALNVTPDSILADDYAPEAKALLAKLGVKFTRTGSTAATIVLLALAGLDRASARREMNRHYNILLVDQFDKRELEQPALYLIMKLLYGEMVGLEGYSFDDVSILNTGSNHNPPEVVLFSLVTSLDAWKYRTKVLG